MSMNFEIPSEVLDEIQLNINNIIQSFDVPDANKMEVIKKINFIYNQTKQLSVIDPLTHLYNRRHFEIEFAREFKRAKRYKNALSIAVVDIDYFKNINDTYGHLCGDFILKELAYLLNQNFRQTDEIYRYGGEEFVVVLTETDIENALIPLERLRKLIEGNKFKYQDNLLSITVSIGYSSNTDFETYIEMFEDADNALYKSKEQGRNRISSSEL